MIYTEVPELSVELEKISNYLAEISRRNDS
jgi:hypothetical protein